MFCLDLKSFLLLICGVKEARGPKIRTIFNVHTRIMGKGGLWVRRIVLTNVKTLCGFIKGVIGGFFILKNK